MADELTRALEIVIAGFVGGLAGIIIQITEQANNIFLSFFVFVFLFIILEVGTYFLLKIFKRLEKRRGQK